MLHGDLVKNMENKEVLPPSDYPHTEEDWEDGLDRCVHCDGGGCEHCGKKGWVSQFQFPPDELLPELSDASWVTGSADWWKEHMRSHLSGVYEAQGHKQPNAAANRVIMTLERMIQEKLSSCPPPPTLLHP